MKKKSPSIQDWFDAYGESHVNPVNKLIHWICVPVIFLCIVGLLSLIPIPTPMAGPTNLIHFGSLGLLLAIVFYARLSWQIALAMTLCSLIALLVIRTINQAFQNDAWLVYVIAFLLAWIGQFIGHAIEGKKPSFLDDLKFLLIGPAWLLGFVFRKLNLKY
ncbi:MAG: hypothetical protein RL226_1296 [Bacteroidota bacterium]|jgi:uncharacterized membrane protein YGL010W